jgi:hypothetical protein
LLSAVHDLRSLKTVNQLSTEYITIRYINCQAKCAKKIVFRSQG